MELTEYDFWQSEVDRRLGTIAWEGYLEAGKAHGILTRFLPGTDFDSAFRKGWFKRMDELQLK